MDNMWERMAHLQLRQMGDLAYRRSFYKYNHRASDASFSDLCREDANLPILKNCRLREPSVLDKLDGGGDAEAHGGGREDMDSEIWRKLPENLIENIFPHLPLHSVLRFRAVCRRWNDLLHCPAFLQAWNRGPSPARESPWLVFRGSSRECVAYNPSLDRWVNVPLGFLPSSRVRVVGSAGGLLCVRRRDDSLMVLNPFTKSFAHLPPKLCRWKYPIVGMVSSSPSSGSKRRIAWHGQADGQEAEGQGQGQRQGQGQGAQGQSASSPSYRVVVGGSQGVPAPDLMTEVYESSSRSWKLVGSKPLRHHFQTNAIHCDGFLYSAGFSVIMVYDLEKEVWSEMQGPPVTHHTNLIMPQICECRGRLLMVEIVSERFVMRRVSIWGTSARGPEKGKWAMLDTMPDELLGEVIAMSNHRFFSYFGDDDLLCFVIARREILAYTVSKRTWRWLPSCPYVRGFAQRFAAFAYHPGLTACE